MTFKNLFFLLIMAVVGALEVSAQTDNAVIDCIMTRTSVRAYSDRAIPDEIVETLLRAGMAAPSAVNKQPWTFVVISNDAVKDSIAASFKTAKMVASAPLAIVVCGNIDNTFTGDTRRIGNWTLDCSAATENILLAAHALGLGGVWCGIYPVEERAEKLRAILDLPANLEPFNIISLGYPKAPSTPKDKWAPSKVIYRK